MFCFLISGFGLTRHFIGSLRREVYIRRSTDGLLLHNRRPLSLTSIPARMLDVYCG